MTHWRLRLLLAIPLVLAAALAVLVFRATRVGDDPRGLHPDAYVSGLAPHDIAATTRAARSLLDVPCLSVVPNGETRSRGEVFHALGLDDRRVGEVRWAQQDRVIFLWWQVSPSYEVVCMAAHDEEATPVALTDSALPVYGVRLVSRADVGEPFGSGWAVRVTAP